MPVGSDASTLILADLDAEVTATRRMIAAFPAAQAEWRPHERSRTLAALAIHHRAQLGVHYRLLGLPVPGMYGPSADDRPAS